MRTPAKNEKPTRSTTAPNVSQLGPPPSTPRMSLSMPNPSHPAVAHTASPKADPPTNQIRNFVSSRLPKAANSKFANNSKNSDQAAKLSGYRSALGEAKFGVG